MATRFKLVAATGKAEDGPLYLKSMALAAGSANATASVQDSAAGDGTDVAKLAALANDGEPWTSGDPRGVYFGTGLYVTLAGTGATLTVEYER